MTTMYTRLTFDITSDDSLIKHTGTDMSDITHILQALLDTYTAGNCSIHVQKVTIRTTPWDTNGNPFGGKSVDEMLHPDDYIYNDEIEEDE